MEENESVLDFVRFLRANLSTARTREQAGHLYHHDGREVA